MRRQWSLRGLFFVLFVAALLAFIASQLIPPGFASREKQPMTPAEIDQRLAERGVRYDMGEEQFFEGDRRLPVKEVNRLLPELTDDEIVSYQVAKWSEAAPTISLD